MRGPAARVLGDLLPRADSGRQTGSQWAGVLVFMTEAAVLLDDADAAERGRGAAGPCPAR